MADIIIVVFIVSFLLIGCKKGLVVTLLNMCSYLVSSLAVFMFFKPVHTYLCGSEIGKSAAKNVSERIAARFSGMSVLNLPLPVILKSGTQENEVIAHSSAAEVIAQNITNALFLVVTFVLLYFVIKLVIKLVRAPLSAVVSLPILKQANKLGGAVVGAAMGILWLYVLTALIAAFSFSAAVAPIADAVSKSHIMGFLYENNFLLNFIKI